VSRIASLTLIAMTALTASIFGTGTAFAAPAPLDPKSGAGQAPIVIERVADTASSPLWQFAVVALVAAALAAAGVATFRALARRRESRRGIPLAA
jgi:hypothetical protein